MRAIATAALVALVWMGSTAPSLSQSGGVIQFGPFHFPIFGRAQSPMGPFVVGPTSGRAHRAPPLGANPGGSPTGSRPTSMNKPAVQTESLSTVIGGSRVKF